VTSIFDAKGKKELDLDLAAEPGKPRSKGTGDLMAAMGLAGLAPPPPPKAAS